MSVQTRSNRTGEMVPRPWASFKALVKHSNMAKKGTAIETTYCVFNVGGPEHNQRAYGEFIQLLQDHPDVKAKVIVQWAPEPRYWPHYQVGREQFQGAADVLRETWAPMFAYADCTPEDLELDGHPYVSPVPETGAWTVVASPLVTAIEVVPRIRGVNMPAAKFPHLNNVQSGSYCASVTMIFQFLTVTMQCFKV